MLDSPNSRGEKFQMFVAPKWEYLLPSGAKVRSSSAPQTPATPAEPQWTEEEWNEWYAEDPLFTFYGMPGVYWFQCSRNISIYIYIYNYIYIYLSYIYIYIACMVSFSAFCRTLRTGEWHWWNFTVSFLSRDVGRGPVHRSCKLVLSDTTAMQYGLHLAWKHGTCSVWTCWKIDLLLARMAAHIGHPCNLMKPRNACSPSQVYSNVAILQSSSQIGGAIHCCSGQWRGGGWFPDL